VLALATNFPQLWHKHGTADRERKRSFLSKKSCKDQAVAEGKSLAAD
jgi:hypothetical protein